MHLTATPTYSFAATLAGACLASNLVAQEVYPLPSSAVAGTHVESIAPFLLPARCVQTKLTDKLTLQATQGLPPSFYVWDMLAIGPNSRFVFVPCELPWGSGVFRYDISTSNTVVLMHGNGIARSADPTTWSINNDDFSNLDPATLTPWGSLVTAEEAVGGRLFEIMQPFASGGGFQVHWRSCVPAVTHEGLRFDATGTLYFVDESLSGSIYKFVPAVSGDLSAGQTFVLSVDAYAADPLARAYETWDSIQNAQTTRVGAATWVPMTDPAGNALTLADPFAFVVVTGGRDAADELVATPYGRPEDVEIGLLANGRQCLYVALTDEHAVLSIELSASSSAIVRRFLDRTTIDLASGNAIGVDLQSPDNLAQDAFGHIYVVEDHAPGDLFKAVDANSDGVAEAVGRIASLDVVGAEPSGLIFDPNDPFRFFISVMHPISGNDAIWTVQTRPYPGDGDPWLLLRSSTTASNPLQFGVAEFVAAAHPNDVITLAVDPSPPLLGNLFVIVAEPFVTALGFPGLTPPVWVNSGASILLASGNIGSLPASAPYGANSVSVPVPAGLGGLSVLAQGVALNPNFGLVWSDGVELVLK